MHRLHNSYAEVGSVCKSDGIAEKPVCAGAIQNMMTALPVVIPAPAEHTLGDAASLHDSIGRAAAACRASILQMRQDQMLGEWTKCVLAPYDDLPTSPPAAADIFLTNWNQCAPQPPCLSPPCLVDKVDLASLMP